MGHLQRPSTPHLDLIPHFEPVGVIVGLGYDGALRALALAIVLCTGCTTIEQAFTCRADMECVDGAVTGSCEATRFCSFPDGKCSSGKRYGKFAGDGLGGVCVGDEPGDAGAPSCGEVDDPCCAGASCARAGLKCGASSMRCEGCVIALAVGDAHACALKRADGTVWCWGKNDHGQLGDGSTNDRPAAVQVKDDRGVPLGSIIQIVAGANHTCAVQSSAGTSYCWGDDSNGQLGYGGNAAVNKIPSPTQLGPTVTLTAGSRHTCGVAMGTNTVWCWGANDVGQLGSPGNPSGASAPVPTVDKAGQLTATVLGSGTTHSCAIRTDGTLWCWGSNVSGELGDGTTAATGDPVQVSAIGTHARSMSGGAHFSCALIDDGSVVCFGQNDHGQCGQPSGSPVLVPTTVGFDAATAVAAGGAPACARRDSGARLQCWGNDATPMLQRTAAGAIAIGATDRCVAGAADVQCSATNPRLACP
jgi:alpha-tubulin suppressor-like RCC1 family protein